MKCWLSSYKDLHNDPGALFWSLQSAIGDFIFVISDCCLCLECKVLSPTSTTCSELSSLFPGCDVFSWLGFRDSVMPFSAFGSRLFQSKLILSSCPWISIVILLPDIVSVGDRYASSSDTTSLDTITVWFSMARTLNDLLLSVYPKTYPVSFDFPPCLQWSHKMPICTPNQ